MPLLAQETATTIAGTWKDVGLFAGVVLIVGFACWKIVSAIGTWLKPHIDRIISAHVDFVEKTSKTMDRQQELMEAQARRLDDIEQNTKAQVQGGEMVSHWNRALSAIHDDVKDTKTTVQRIEGKMKQ